MAGRHRKPRPGPGRHRKKPPPGRWASPVLAGLIVLGIGGVGAATALTDNGGGGDKTRADAPPAVTTPSPLATTPTQSASPSPSPSPTPSATHTKKPAAHHSNARFEVTVTGRVAWISVTVRGRRTLFAGLAHHGRTLRFNAHPLDVVIGDAGAVRTIVHGHVHAPAGRRGQVLVFSVR